ncbi:MAG: helix-turn-helix transcriptional regulator [Clostridia bacterium]|nr:helix-turn-helix transcriptional regulator [Clostridia bacterium]
MKLNIGENIRRLRRAADMTQEQLADKLGVSYQSVSRWENGTTYPDMEFLPVLSSIFGVTVDELIGMEESKKKEQIYERYRVYGELCDGDQPEEVVSLLRELRRDCMTDPALSGYLWQLFSNVQYGSDAVMHHPDVLSELRITAKEILDGNYERWLKDSVVEHMSYIEDDEHVESFLDQYATERNLTKDMLLYNRYRGRDEWDKSDPLRQKRLFSIIHDQFGNSGLWRRGDRPNHVHESLQINTTMLNFIHNLCGVTPDPAHPITGDGSVDIFVGDRVEIGIRRACYLASTGDPEGAFVVLEDTVSMIEKVMSLPDKTVLSCKSICLEDEQFELRRFVNHSKENPDYDRRPFLRFFRGKGTDEYVYTLGFRFPLYALTAPHGWEWFDPIRPDPRFAAYVERVEAVFAPVTPEKAAEEG